MNVDCRPIALLNPEAIGVNSANLDEESFASFPIEFGRRQTPYFGCDLNLGWFPNAVASSVWDPLRPLNSTISVSVDSEPPRQIWHPDAWIQLKWAVQDYPVFDDTEILLDTSKVLELASVYLSEDFESVIQASFATIVSTAKAFGLLEPIARKLRNVINRVLKASTLYGGKAFLVSVFQSVSDETAAQDHTLHIESIALARDHSRIKSDRVEKRNIHDSERVGACKELLNTLCESYFGPSVGTLSLCACSLPTTAV